MIALAWKGAGERQPRYLLSEPDHIGSCQISCHETHLSEISHDSAGAFAAAVAPARRQATRRLGCRVTLLGRRRPLGLSLEFGARSGGESRPRIALQALQCRTARADHFHRMEGEHGSVIHSQSYLLRSDLGNARVGSGNRQSCQHQWASYGSLRYPR